MKTWISAQMGRFVILGAVFCVGTLLVVSEVKAQIRPAFTKNVDEPGRTPRSTLSQFFLQAGASGCYGGDCANYLGFGSTGAIFDLPPVPAGKRWIVVMATGGFVSGDGRVIEIQLQNSRGSLIFDSLKWIFGGPYSKSPSFAAATFSERMFATFEPGETPSLRVTTDGAIGFSTIALQGYLIDANN